MNEMALGDPPNINSLLSVVSGVPDMWAHVNHQEIEAQLKRDMAQAQMQAQMQAQINAHLASGAQNVTHPFPKPLDKASWRPDVSSPPTPLASRAREMFLKRMGGIRSEMKVNTDDFLACHVHKDQVYVFYCFDGRHGVTVEGIDLFPSDQLITQFRLVLT